jgi:hypothetical protein
MSITTVCVMLVELYFYEARRKVRVQETERLKCFSRPKGLD